MEFPQIFFYGAAHEKESLGVIVMLTWLVIGAWQIFCSSFEKEQLLRSF